MWACCKEKHEDIVRATFDVLQALAADLPLDRLAQLFSKIKELNPAEFDEKTINFLRLYTVNSLKNEEQKARAQMD